MEDLCIYFKRYNFELLETKFLRLSNVFKRYLNTIEI